MKLISLITTSGTLAGRGLAVSLSAMFLLAGLSTTASAAECGSGKIPTSKGCRGSEQVRSDLNLIVRSVKQDKGLSAVIARVDLRGRTLLRRGYGYSQTGVHAAPGQSFRLGSMVIPALTSVIFQLRDSGRLKLTDPVTRWLPSLPDGDGVTIMMLLNNSSGYQDWIQKNEAFVEALYADPFRTWKENELLRIALDRGSICDPGSCFNYAHTNYLILGKVIREITGSSIRRILNRKMIRPAGMDRVRFSVLPPMPSPTLNAYTSERGFFENSTGWSPSWGLGPGQLISGTVDDVVKGARTILSGRLLKPRSRRQLFESVGPLPAGIPPGTWFAQGVIVSDGWRIQNPYFNGYMGHMAWLPKRRLAIGLVNTVGRTTSPDDTTNFSGTILRGIAAYLTPAHIPAI